MMLLKCGVGEDSRVPWAARRSNQSILKEMERVTGKKAKVSKWQEEINCK